jgi:hypothetical protein
MRRFLVLILLGLSSARAFAQPAEVSRVLRSFDFEERRLGNDEDLPMHWTKVVGSGLPHYVNGCLSTDRARSGDYSFRFDLNGGSLIYRYDPDQIHVQPGAHYRVEGFVQTTAMPNARARITAYLIDQDGRPMMSSVRHSEPFVSKSGDTSWQQIGVEVTASADVPADPSLPIPVPTTLGIELEFLQPSQYAPSTLGQRTLFTQDIHGSAWFDDITVSQVPKVTMSTDRPGNIFRRTDPLTLKVLVNDRFTDDLAAQLVITDAQGKKVYQRSGALDMSAAEQLGPGEKQMNLALPELRPGWYEAALVMSSMGQFVGKQTLDLVLLADDSALSQPDPRFGIIATDLPFDGWEDLPEILTLLSAGRVKLAVWSDAGDVQQVDSAGFDRLLERLAERHIEPTACLVNLPPNIAQQVQRTQLALGAEEAAAQKKASWIDLLKCDPQFWQPQLSYMIARHATHLDRWQLGADGSDDFVAHPQMREVYTQIYKEFTALVDKPDLAMPWPAWYELDGQLPATVALHVKPEVLPSQVPLYVHDIQNLDSKSGPTTSSANQLSQNHNLSIFLEPLDRAQYGREVQIRDLVERIIYALSADARRIDLKLPFTVTRQADRADGSDETITKQPQELLIVIRTVMSLLSGATFKGKVPIADGVEAFLFDRGGQGVLVLWDRGTTGGVKPLAINLGAQPRRVDLWGNATPLIQSNSKKGDSADVKLEIGPMPIFLVDIDGQLAQLRASVAFDNPLLESSFMPHARKITFTNPYHQAISGSFKLAAPAGWVINPPTMTYSLNPGETFEREVMIEFPYNSFAGPKTINAEFQVQAENNSTFTVPIVLKLGLSDVGLQSLALRDGNDVIVQQMVTNYGEKPIDYTAFAIFPGQARQERLVTGLAAGRTTIKKYRFTNVRISKEVKVRSGLKELDGTRILNDEVAIQ